MTSALRMHCLRVDVLLPALAVALTEYEGTSPILRRYRRTKIDVWKFNLIGKGKSMVRISEKRDRPFRHRDRRIRERDRPFR
ncbi:MAG: hypothetical protein L6Q68_20170, partial [Aquabacterium sp.]|nr:hypothetical protein [Aquabacterium sp.]